MKINRLLVLNNATLLCFKNTHIESRLLPVIEKSKASEQQLKTPGRLEVKFRERGHSGHWILHLDGRQVLEGIVSPAANNPAAWIWLKSRYDEAVKARVTTRSGPESREPNWPGWCACFLTDTAAEIPPETLSVFTNAFVTLAEQYLASKQPKHGSN